MYSTIKAKFVTRLTSLGYTEQAEFFENENIAQPDKTYSIRCYGLEQGIIGSKYNTVFLKMGVVISINYDLHLGNSYSASIDLIDDLVTDVINPDNYPTGARLIDYDGLDLNIDNDTLEAKVKFKVEYAKNN